MMSDPEDDLLRPPQRTLNPDYIVPLSPPIRPPFAHYKSTSSLPATPHTPFPTQSLGQTNTMSSTPLRPYLTLPPRILLTFFSPALLPIILTIAHLIQNRSSTASLAATLRSSLLSACSGIAKGAASIQALPRYLAMQTNDAAIEATQASILAIGAMLIDSVTIIETVVNFIVDTYRSMLLCTLELAIRGTLELLIDAVQTISSSVTSALDAVRTDIQDDISSANSAIQTAVSAINTVTSLVDVTLTVPNFTIPSLTFLENVTIPTSFESTLITLNSSLPTLTELKEKMDSIIDTPFELLIQEINSTRLEMAASFNSSLLPVPSLSSLSAQDSTSLSNELCSDLDTSLIDDTANALHKLSNVAIGLMFLLLFLIWAALAIWEWRRWRALRSTVEVVEDEWRREGAADAWRTVAIVEHPMLEKYSGAVLRRVAPSPRTHVNLRWFLSYLAHPTCLSLLFVALLGFLSIQFQLVALNAIKAHSQETANATVTASTESLITKLNAAAANSSLAYAEEFNTAIATYEARINDELFGSWLNTTAVTLNSTLVTFYDEIETLLNATFGGTILYGPINTFIYCILGSKITNLEEGLTWISNHAQVTLPTVSSNILVLSNSSMNEIAAPIASAAAGSSTDSSDDGVVGTLIDHFESALVVERNFYAILLGVWLGLFLIGLIVVIWHSGGRDKYTAWRGDRSASDSNGDTEGRGRSRWLPWMKDTHPIYDEYAEKRFRGTPVPRIVEPEQETKTSFFNYPSDNDRKSSSTPRPSVGRSGTFGSTFSSLAAPGQAFLKVAGRKLSGLGGDQQHREWLVDGGVTSEKYTSTYHNDDPRRSSGLESERVDTPPPFWVNKFYGALGGVKSLFPTSGQRHGLALGSALGRNASQRTERSFGASQVPTAMTPAHDWAGAGASLSTPTEHSGHGQQKDVGEWSMVDPQSIGRALEAEDDHGRYPTIGSGHQYQHQHQPQRRSNPLVQPDKNYHSQPIYPRRMSRAPTLAEGAIVGHRFADNPFDDAGHPPDIPSKDSFYATASGNTNINQLDRERERGRETYIPRPWETQYANSEGPQEDLRSVASPTSLRSENTTKSYFAAEPQVSSANRVHLNHHTRDGGNAPSTTTMGVGAGTTALTDILREMQERRRNADPFSDGQH